MLEKYNLNVLNQVSCG